MELIKKILQTYKALGLKTRRLYLALAMMLITSALEMLGLSILYPLVLALGGQRSGVANLLPFPMPVGLAPRDMMLVLFVSVAVLYVLKNVALYFSYQYNINFAIYFCQNLMRGLYRAHLQKPLLEFKNESAGSLSNLVCVQTQKLMDGSIRPLMVALSEFFILVGITSLIFFLSPQLMTALAITCGGSGVLYYWALRSKTLAWGQNEMQAASALQELVANTSKGISEIKIFGKEAFLSERLYETAGRKLRMFHHLEMHQQGPRYIAESMFILTVVVFFSFDLWSGADPARLLAEFSVIAAASFRILPSVNRIVHSYSNVTFNRGPALLLLNTILDSHILEKRASAEADKPLLEPLESLELQGVSFQYPGAPRAVLSPTSAVFQGGDRIGLVGDSGSGKSTLLKILAGLYPPTSGKLLANGKPCAAFTVLQAQVGYVPQESFIMPGSILENVAFQDTYGVDAERVWQCLRATGLEPLVRSLPGGLDSQIGEKGIEFSGGQKQLLCIARALFRSPRLLLLDEPTASLDSQNEALVLEAIRRLPKNTLVVMVSHRHQNFVGFDKVYTYDPQARVFRAGQSQTRNEGSLDHT
ncbi:ABC transporter ATP-binding protein/permease, partial [bacterium]|nr:ABC transporter ATP-binding protein/permease [bacterium]